MAYCPKCGVEVERSSKNCPLCNFPMPDIGDQIETSKSRYPKAINTYSEDHLGKKNKAFFSIGIIALSILVILLVFSFVYLFDYPILQYIALGDIGIFAIVFFSMGYLKPRYNFLGLYLSVLLVSFGVYSISGGQEWFLDYAVPIATLIYVDICVFRLIFKHNRHRNQFIYIPTNLIFSAIIACIGLDSLISFNILGVIKLSWSLIVLVTGGCIILLLQSIYHGIPEKTRRMLKKKMHV